MAECGYRGLVPINPTSDLIAAQNAADRQQQDWVFDAPERVDTDALARFAHVPEDKVVGIKQTHAAQGRFVYSWKPVPNGDSYMVVVSRPYWLSFYAKDPKLVAWTVIAAYVSSCGKDNSVIRLQ
jgi:hypothetical protein